MRHTSPFLRQQEYSKGRNSGPLFSRQEKHPRELKKRQTMQTRFAVCRNKVFLRTPCIIEEEKLQLGGAAGDLSRSVSLLLSDFKKTDVIYFHSNSCINSRLHQCHRQCLVIGVITQEATFPRWLTVSTAQGQSHGLSHETTAMAIKKPITSSARWLTSAFCVWGPAVTMVPGPAFACEQLRQPSGVSRTHNRKTLVVLLNRFSLLPSRFREGWGDVQTQCTASSRSSHSDLPPPLS